MSGEGFAGSCAAMNRRFKVGARRGRESHATLPDNALAGLAVHFVGVTVNAILNFFRRVIAEVIGLTRHRPKTTDLPIKPFVNGHALTLIAWIKLSGLAAEILQNCA